MQSFFFYEKHLLTLVILATIKSALLWIHDPRNYEVTLTTKNYNEISWVHRLHSIDLCKTESCLDFTKETTFGLDQPLVSMHELDYRGRFLKAH